jgi:hypothetical protein
MLNWRSPLLRFRSALHCGYSGITGIQGGIFFVLTRARTFKKARVRCAYHNNVVSPSHSCHVIHFIEQRCQLLTFILLYIVQYDTAEATFDRLAVRPPTINKLSAHISVLWPCLGSAIANSKIFAKTLNIFIRGRYLYQWYHYNHKAKRYENVIRGISSYHKKFPSKKLTKHRENRWSVIILY